MYIIFILNHPAHYHLFKNTITELNAKGHECEIFIRPKDVLKQLLDHDGIAYNIIDDSSRNKKNIIISSIFTLLKKEFKLSRFIRARKPDMMIGTDWAITHLGKIFSIPSLIFNEDDTTATPENKFFYPFAKTLVLPDCCDKGMWLKKRVSYSGYHELAYLHPKRFSPDDNLVSSHIDINKPFIVIRLVQLTASHDLGKKGLGKYLLNEIIKMSNEEYQILISYEGGTSPEHEKYLYAFDPSSMHHFLGKAHAVIGDSQTMIAEAAVLGTPAIRFNDFVGKIGYLNELEHRYGLSFGYRTNQKNEFLTKISEILEQKDIKKTWNQRLKQMLDDKIDVTSFMVWFIENYPESIQIVKTEPDFQFNFR